MIEIDACHRELIAAVVRCHKPQRILELGYGTGKTTQAMLDAIAANGQHCDLTVVDNFVDWGYVPQDIPQLGFNLVQADEGEYLSGMQVCTRLFDVIVADADHNRTHEHVWKILQLLNSGGFAFFHDVLNPAFPNLRLIPMSLHGITFFCSSLPDEQCNRGLFMYRKP